MSGIVLRRCPFANCARLARPLVVQRVTRRVKCPPGIGYDTYNPDSTCALRPWAMPRTFYAARNSCC